MPSYVTIKLDTLAPASASIVLAGGSAYTNTQDITATIGTTDGVTTGYQMKLWGDVDGANDTNVQPTEGASVWVTYTASKSIKLSSGDGAKTINCKIRDSVLNECSVVSDSINLDTSAPTVTVTGPDLSVISEVSPKNVSAIDFSSNEPFVEYKVKVVPASGSLNDAGTQIPTTAGSTNVSGTAGNYQASTPIHVTINATDMKTASAGDGDKIIKVFVKDASGSWSI